MQENRNSKPYDFEERTYKFAADCRSLIKRVTKNVSNIEDTKQLARSSGSIPANYIEANESLSRKDFIMRIKICRKESKESSLWLRLLDIESNEASSERNNLRREANELMKIFGAILQKSK